MLSRESHAWHGAGSASGASHKRAAHSPGKSSSAESPTPTTPGFLPTNTWTPKFFLPWLCPAALGALWGFRRHRVPTTPQRSLALPNLPPALQMPSPKASGARRCFFLPAQSLGGEGGAAIVPFFSSVLKPQRNFHRAAVSPARCEGRTGGSGRLKSRFVTCICATEFLVRRLVGRDV